MNYLLHNFLLYHFKCQGRYKGLVPALLAAPSNVIWYCCHIALMLSMNYNFTKFLEEHTFFLNQGHFLLSCWQGLKAYFINLKILVALWIANFLWLICALKGIYRLMRFRLTFPRSTVIICCTRPELQLNCQSFDFGKAVLLHPCSHKWTSHNLEFNCPQLPADAMYICCKLQWRIAHISKVCCFGFFLWCLRDNVHLFPFPMLTVLSTTVWWKNKPPPNP